MRPRRASRDSTRRPWHDGLPRFWRFSAIRRGPLGRASRKWRPRLALSCLKTYQQLSGRHAAPFIRDVMARFRRGLLSAGDASGELDLSRSRFYVLYAGYLRACAERRQRSWRPGHSGGAHHPSWPRVITLLHNCLGPPGGLLQLCRLGSASPPSSQARSYRPPLGLRRSWPRHRSQRRPEAGAAAAVQQIGQLAARGAARHIAGFHTSLNNTAVCNGRTPRRYTATGPPRAIHSTRHSGSIDFSTGALLASGLPRPCRNEPHTFQLHQPARRLHLTRGPALL